MLVNALLLALLFAFGLSGATPVILDTDIGDDIDDALALALALQSPELDIRAIVTVLQHGDRRADLTWKILELYGRTDIPVGVGAEQPLLAAQRQEQVVQTRALEPSYRIPAGKRRVGLQLLIDTCLNAPGKITILAYGPATNIALALRAEPRIKQKIEKIVLMNGVFFRAGLEYNTYRDPEASAIVYAEGVPVEAVGLDVTTKCMLSPQHLDSMQKSPHPSVRFLRELIGYWQGGKTDKMPTLHDPLAILVTFQPSLVDYATGEVKVETHGQQGVSYGLTAFRAKPEGHVKVAREVRSGAAVDLFMSRVAAAPRAR